MLVFLLFLLGLVYNPVRSAFVVTPEVAQNVYAKTQTALPPGQARTYNIGDKYVSRNNTGVCNGHFSMWMYFRTPDGYPNGWTNLANLETRTAANAFTYYIDAAKGKSLMTYGAFAPVHVVYPDASYFFTSDRSFCWKLPRWGNSYESQQKGTAVLWEKNGRTLVYDGMVGDLGSSSVLTHNRVEIDMITGFPSYVVWSQLLPMPVGVVLPFPAYGKGEVVFESCQATTPPDSVFDLPPACNTPGLWEDASGMASVYDMASPKQPLQYFPYPFVELLGSK